MGCLINDHYPFVAGTKREEIENTYKERHDSVNVYAYFIHHDRHLKHE
jgi:hypothetical protein